MQGSIGELTSIKTGKLDANASVANGRYPFFTCSKETLTIDSYSYDCECVLVAGNGDLNVKYYNGKFDAYQRTYIIEDASDGKLYMKYLYWFMSSYINELRKQAIGGVIKYIKLGNLTGAKIQLPSIKKQMEIVNIITKVNNVLCYRESQLHKLDELIQARFVEMFGDPALNPNGWEKVNLGSVCDVRDGTHDSPKYFTEGYPLVTSKNVTSGRIDFTDCSLICEEDYNKINERSKVDFGDILMPMIGTVGKPVIVDVDAEFAIKNVALIKFYDDSKVINIFVRALLQSDYFDRAVISRIRGGTQKFIALGDIRKLEICLPPMATQLAFREFAHQVNKSKLVIKTCCKYISIKYRCENKKLDTVSNRSCTCMGVVGLGK